MKGQACNPITVIIKRFVKIFIFCLVFCLCRAGCAAAWEGSVLDVADGDTVSIAAEGAADAALAIRLYGIDAPEKGQAGGAAAREYLRQILPPGSRVRVVTMQAGDRYGRQVALVFLRGGADQGGSVCVNAEMVRAGHAWVAQKYCGGKMCGAWQDFQRQARQAGRGVWQDADPLPPWLWRQEKKGH